MPNFDSAQEIILIILYCSAPHSVPKLEPINHFPQVNPGLELLERAGFQSHHE